MKFKQWFACRNVKCPRYGEHRDGRGSCPGCGWMTALATIVTEIRS